LQHPLSALFTHKSTKADSVRAVTIEGVIMGGNSDGMNTRAEEGRAIGGRGRG
jgi:hypothetical protein